MFEGFTRKREFIEGPNLVATLACRSNLAEAVLEGKDLSPVIVNILESVTQAFNLVNESILLYLKDMRIAD